MEILLVSGDFVKKGGMDRANYAVADYLARRGDRVHLAAYRVADDLLARPNVTFHRAAKPLGSYSLGNQVLRRVAHRAAERLASRGARVLVNGGNCDWPDVNWVHHINATDRPPPRSGVAARVKSWLDHRIYVAEERAIIPRARVILVTCERMRRELLLAMPELCAERLHVVHLGIEPKLFYPASAAERAATRQRLGWDLERPKILFIGALGNHRKGFDTLFDAWRRLCATPSWDADLVVVGEGAELPSWQARAREASLDTRIAFLGSRRDLPEILRAADGHVLPSRYEGYSMVTQEALCCGLPALVTASAGVALRYPEPLADLLVPDPEDVLDLVARLQRWRARVGRAWPELAAFSAELRGHTWEHMASQMVEAVEKANPQ